MSPLALRLIVIKGDGPVLIHSDTGGEGSPAVAAIRTRALTSDAAGSGGHRRAISPG